MFHKPAKRKLERRERYAHTVDVDPFKPDPALYIQAHEADIIRGPRAIALARSLEAQYAEEAQEESPTRLIRLHPTEDGWRQGGRGANEPMQTVWVDRYVKLLTDMFCDGPGCCHYLLFA